MSCFMDLRSLMVIESKPGAFMPSETHGMLRIASGIRWNELPFLLYIMPPRMKRRRGLPLADRARCLESEDAEEGEKQ
jgi:hypothetical protein